MAPGSRPVDSEARGGCPELGAPTAASGEAPVGPPGCELGRRAVRPIQAAWRRRDRATGVPLTSDDGSPGELRDASPRTGATIPPSPRAGFPVRLPSDPQSAAAAFRYANKSVSWKQSCQYLTISSALQDPGPRSRISAAPGV